ncbi:hypothetical protein N657DRAFT_589193 [Parathielavia appendiculata]|uniref:Uncharacterized protein n=1 Tax=Parathielavia appendiculata TaxID=2587402 RepID=A0AAN6U6A7_9PEZI|nr:hypothetical protein N657DRAFT_589193 [Parathielavia appendiculata]
MSALRQRAARLALQFRTVRPGTARNTRSYASDHGHHEAPHAVEESLGPAFYITLATFTGSIFVYSISRPGENGESTIHRWLRKISDYGTEWETRNHLMTAALEQAAHDKHLLYGAERSRHYELTYPEVFTHGSPFNVPAGHYANIDKVVAHYKKQYHEDEARKAKKLAAASETSQ